MKKGSYRFTIMNASNFKLFTSPLYKPVWRAMPGSAEWQRVIQTTTFTNNFASSYKFSWNFDCNLVDNEIFFALAPPYSYEHLVKTLDLYESLCPLDCVFYREVLAKSLDGRDVEILTISAKKNFTNEREEKEPGFYPNNYPRCFKATKPIVFISCRVHPGETPSSYMLDSIIQMLVSKDPRGMSLRNNFVFKIVPMLNPDGVARGHFRVDQNGINLNRCYAFPSMLDQPSIFATKLYIENTIGNRVCFYLDLHAHGSKKSCFVFGNCLDMPRQADNELYGKLLEINSPFFDYFDNDFTEKNMTAKDPKDHHSKEGSGRVAFFRSIGLVYCYTVEASYYIPKGQHVVAPLVNMKTGRKCPETVAVERYIVQVYNRHMFVDIGISILTSILDIFKANPLSRLPATEYKTVDSLKEYVGAFIQSRKQSKLKKSLSRSELPKVNTDKKFMDIAKKSSKLPIMMLKNSDRNNELARNTVCRFKSSYKYSSRPKTIDLKYKTQKCIG